CSNAIELAKWLTEQEQVAWVNYAGLRDIAVHIDPGDRRDLGKAQINCIAQEAVRVSPRCVVITGDIPLADRCLKAGARVLKHNGAEFTPASIGSALATRAILEDLRAGMDGIDGGPPPFNKADRSQFLQSLDRVMMGLARG
ncbi:MAG: DUF188 domain-containing protein, partial [Erythrobacter sp.]|nr:DUF188 domain-containing protein [Erythrobacter sp.]